MKKTLKQRIHDYWYVEPYQADKKQYYGLNNVYYENQYNEVQEEFNKRAKEEQNRNRLLVIMLILAVPFIICTYLLIFKVILCLGLLLACIGMLLK